MLLQYGQIRSISSKACHDTKSGAIMLSTRLDRMIQQELNFTIHDSFFLCCVVNDDRRYKNSVANSVAPIPVYTLLSQWKYLDSKANQSRGLLANQQKYWITDAQVSPEKNLAQQAVSSLTQTVREMRPESFR